MKYIAVLILVSIFLSFSYAQQFGKGSLDLAFLERKPKCACVCFIGRAKRRTRRMCKANRSKCRLRRCRFRRRRGLKCCPTPTPNPPTPTPEPDSLTPEPTLEPDSLTPEPTPEPDSLTPEPTPEPDSLTPEPTPESPTPAPTPCMDVAMVSIGGGGAPPPGIAPEPESSAEESPCPVGEMRFTIVIQLDTCPSIRLYSVMICGEDLNGATTELKEVLNDVNDFYITRNTMKSRGAMSILEGVFDEFDEDDLKFAFLAENLQ